MDPAWPDLLLPCSPSRRCLDRFSLIDEEVEDKDGRVALWPLLQHVLQQPVTTPTQLVEALDTIANTAHGSSGTAGDFGTLREAVDQDKDTFFSRIWPTIAVRMYLAALFSYFDQLSAESNLEYAEYAGGLTFSTEQQELEYQGHDCAVVVSANKDIGFGQSATQEEVFMGNCPEACPAVLFTPTLQDNQILAINGARPMLRIQGQRRDLSWEKLAPKSRRGGRMLLMDALELDEAEGSASLLPDLKPENMQREMRKAYTAFSSWKGEGGSASAVWTGLWGCGAFNGDPGVKVLLMWMAASLAGKELRLLCDDSQRDFADKVECFVERGPHGYVLADSGDKCLVSFVV
ncbi:hypothetical protein TgHK011_003173 [Trichoderma gracile]|nr:hypothetical protein TgHK011_003173 [Trichoderma gracile]